MSRPTSLRPGVKYTRQELVALMDGKTAEDLAFQGYVLRHDYDTGLFSIIPWSQAGGQMFTEERRPQIYTGGEFEPLDPIKKRTAQQRVDSLMLRWIEDCKKYGTIPGLDDPMIRTIVGEAWKAGRTEITADIVREVATYFLQDAENKKNAADFKKVTK